MDLRNVVADLVLVVHLGFIAFVAFGALLVLRWPRAAWFHVPAVTWGILVELVGLTCPLTPLEVHWRRLAGDEYSRGFIDYYVGAVVYPAGLTRGIQIGLGTLLVVVNGVVYAIAIGRARSGKSNTRARPFETC